MKIKTILCLVLLLSLSSCGGVQHWEKPNASPMDVQHAFKGCMATIGASEEQAALFMGSPEMQGCMNAKGFYLVH